MSKLEKRAAYVRGLADGMELDTQDGIGRIVDEMLKLEDAMAKKITKLTRRVAELEDYVDELDGDLGEVEEYIYGEEEDECGCCHCGDDDDDEDEDEEIEELEELSFDCPNCGETVMLKAADIDYDQSPVCKKCGKPFFVDASDDEEE